MPGGAVVNMTILMYMIQVLEHDVIVYEAWPTSILFIKCYELPYMAECLDTRYTILN